MRDDITIEHKGEYVHVQHYGKDSYAIALGMWRDIVAACEKHQCFNILCETFTTDELSATDCYRHIELFPEIGVTIQHRIAWVHHVDKTRAGIEMIETVLRNRNLADVQLFANIEDARKWLLGEEDG